LEEEPAEPELILPKIPEPKPEAPLSRGPSFLLRNLEFVGNTVFNKDDLREVGKAFLDRLVSSEDLENLRRAITQEYVNAGYINSGAILPDQQIVDGRVTFVIIEGELTEVEVQGVDRLSQSYVANRILLSAGPPLNVNDLQARLRIMLDDPLIHRIDAELLPGLRPGQSRLVVRIEEEPIANAVFFVDNSRVQSVGGQQVGTVLALKNPFGLGEILTISPSVAEGLFEIEGRIEVPVSDHDTRLLIRGQYTQSEVVEDPFDALDIESKANEIGIAVAQPIYRAPGQDLTFTLGFDRRETKTYLLGGRFSFSEGVQNGKSVVSVFRGILEWVDRSQNQVIAVRSTTSLGVDVLGATDNSGSTPDGEFFAWLGQAQIVRRLEPTDIQIIARGEMQWTDDRLLPLEQYAVGGINTVRGYREDFNIGDKGWNLSVEGRLPILDLDLPFVPPESADGRFDLRPFVDIGRAWNNKGPKNDTLASIGLGFGWAITQTTDMEFYYGYQIEDVPDPEDEGLQDYGIHFSVRTRF
jgi:hemolysin activation/secretion protein